MPRYNNGVIALNQLVEFDSGGGKHWGTRTTRARWYAGRAAIKKRTGITLNITPGWNVYRPYSEQVKGRADACRQGNCNAAAQPGYSSHGGTWISAKYTGGVWVDAFAIDVGDYRRVPWSIFKEEMERVGFLVGAITPEIAGIFEPWHIIDLNPYGSFSGGETPPKPAPTPNRKKQSKMITFTTIATDGKRIWALAGTSPGTPANWIETRDQTTANGFAQATGGGSVSLTVKQWDSLKKAFLEAVKTTS